MRLHDLRHRGDEILVPLRRHQPRDRPDRNRRAVEAEGRLGRGDICRGPRPRKLVERRAEIDDLRALGRHQAGANRELRRRLGDGDRQVGVRRQQPIRHLLKPRRRRVIGVLVQNRRNPHPPRAQPAERRRAVAVHVDDVGLLVAQHAEQRRERSRIELVPAHVGDVDAKLLERLLRQILPAQADERHVVARAIEARNHPREQPLDAVHPRSLPAEMVADVDHVQRTHVSFQLPVASSKRPSVPLRTVTAEFQQRCPLN